MILHGFCVQCATCLCRRMSSSIFTFFFLLVLEGRRRDLGVQRSVQDFSFLEFRSDLGSSTRALPKCPFSSPPDRPVLASADRAPKSRSFGTKHVSDVTSHLASAARMSRFHASVSVVGSLPRTSHCYNLSSRNSLHRCLTSG